MEINPDTLEIEIVDIEPIDGGVQVFARAWSDGVQIGFGKDGTVDIERFRFFNPPILVPDNDGTIVIQTGSEEIGVPLRQEHYREDIVQSLLYVLSSNIIGLKNTHPPTNIIANKIGQTTSTFYSGAADEYVYGQATSWAAVRSAGGTGGSNVATILAIQSSRETASNWLIYRSPVPFDTSAIPDADVISSATLYITPQTINDAGADNQFICVDKVTTITPTTGDYAISNWAGVDQAARRDFTGLAVNTETSLALNATGISNISKTSTTNFGFRTSFDLDNTTPTGVGGDKRVFPYASEDGGAGTTRDPRLVIEHSAGGGPTPNNSARRQHLMMM